MVLGFSQSAEFTAATAPALKAWMRGLDEFGDDVLVGGLWSDTFALRPDGSRDRVLDLEPWDRIDLYEFGYADTAEARAHFSQSGHEVVFADGDTQALFQGVQLAQIGADTFYL